MIFTAHFPDAPPSQHFTLEAARRAIRGVMGAYVVDEAGKTLSYLPTAKKPADYRREYSKGGR